MSQGNKSTNKIQLYSIPNYSTSKWESNRMNIERYVDIDNIDAILRWGSNKCLYEIIEQDVVRLSVDIDGTEVDIEEIYDIVVHDCKQLFGIDVDVYYTENIGYTKAGSSHHLVVDGISCNRKTQVYFWNNIKQLHPDKDFEKSFDTGYLKASRALLRFPYQQKECKTDTEHIIQYGELKSFALNYIKDCTDVTEILNKLYVEDINKSIAQEKAKIERKNMDNVVMEATTDNIQKIREFSMLLPERYIFDYHDWRNISFHALKQHHATPGTPFPRIIYKGRTTRRNENVLNVDIDTESIILFLLTCINIG